MCERTFFGSSEPRQRSVRNCPSGAERQIHRGGSLSTEIQNHAQALPLACEDQLPKLPSDLERVVYSGRVLLIDSKGHVMDMFQPRPEPITALRKGSQTDVAPFLAELSSKESPGPAPSDLISNALLGYGSSW